MSASVPPRKPPSPKLAGRSPKALHGASASPQTPAVATTSESPLKEVELRGTHRLIPSRYSPAETVLARLSASPATLSGLMELDDATNDRFLGEEGLLSGISIHELVYGVRYAHIVNAAFTHASPSGGRFNATTRGAWYAATERPTAVAEVAFHRQRQLEEVAWRHEEVSTVDDYLADIFSPMHDLRGGNEAPPFPAYLQPDPVPACYAPSQRLAADLLSARSNGIVYPSVRLAGGTCIACFRPALVYNVRRGARLELHLLAGRSFRPSQAQEVPIQG